MTRDDQIVNRAGDRRIGNYETDFREQKHGLGTAVNLRVLSFDCTVRDCNDCIFKNSIHSSRCKAQRKEKLRMKFQDGVKS